MKIKNQEKVSTFSLRLTQEEREIFTKLKEVHGVNVSGAIKISLREKLKQLDKLEQK